MPFNPIKEVEEKQEFKPVRKAFDPQGAETARRMYEGGLVGHHQAEAAQAGLEWAKQHPREVGAGVGGAVGMLGGIPGSVAGGVLGGVAGELYGQSQDPPENVVERDRRLAGAALLSGVEELGGVAVTGVARKILSPLGKHVTPAAKDAINTLKAKMPKNLIGMRKPPLTLAEATEHRVVDFLDNIAQNAVFGQKSMAEYRGMRDKIVTDVVDDYLNIFGQKFGPTEFGSFTAKLLDKKWTHFKRHITAPIYNTVTKEAPNAVVSIKSLKDFVAPKAGRIKLQKGSSGATIIETINSLPDDVPYEIAKNLRSDLRTIKEGFELTIEAERAKGIAKNLEGKLTGEIETALKKESVDAYRAWKYGNYVYRKGSEKYRNEFIRGIIKRSKNKPHEVLKAVFEKHGTTGVKRIQNVVGPKVWKRLKGYHSGQMFTDSQAYKEGIGDYMSGKKLKSLLSDRRSGYGKETLNSIYNKDELKTLNDLATTLSVTQERQPGRGGGMWIQLTQPLAFGALLMGRFDKAAGTILVGPAVLARMMHDPIISKYFLNQLRLPKGSHLLPSNMMRIAGMSRGFYDQILKEERGY
ncbi:MAG: hypothetical protein ACYTFW_00870 [Planctomycetota bacterium]|jgi:hypothetical protein